MTLWICIDLYLIFIGSFLAIYFYQICFPLTGSFEISVLVFRNWTVEHSGPMIFRIQKSNFLLEAWISQHFTIIFPWNDFFPHHFPWKKTRLCWVFRVTPSLLVHWPGRPGVGGQISWWCCLGFTLWLCQNSYWKWPSRNSEFSHE